MSFASGFYSLRIDLSDPENNRYEKIRIKTARHPLETSEHLAAKFLAFAHCYRQRTEFSGGLFDPQEPSILRKDITGEWLSWIYVGVPSKKSLETIMRNKDCEERRIYLYAEAQKEELRHVVSSLKNQRAPLLRIFFVDPEKLSLLVECEATSAEWKVTLVDEQAFISCGSVDVDLEIKEMELDRIYRQAVA